VPPRLSTGLAGLDAQLGGGIPPGTSHVVLGEPMNAVEQLAWHFAAAGSLTGAGCAFFTADATEAEVKAGVEAVGGRKDRVHVVTLPYKGRWAIPDAKAGMRYVVDDFSAVIRNAGWSDAQGQLKRLKAQMRASGDNLFVLVTSALHADEENVLLRQWADGVLELGFDRQGFALYPYLKVTKMRGVPDSSRFILFRETERGLFMESTKRVF
jgi:archaeal flagellar protein FlaH